MEKNINNKYIYYSIINNLLKYSKRKHWKYVALYLFISLKGQGWPLTTHWFSSLPLYRQRGRTIEGKGGDDRILIIVGCEYKKIISTYI